MISLREYTLYDQEDLSILIAVNGSKHSSAALSLMARIPLPVGSSMHVLAVAPERWLPSELGSEDRSALAETLDTIRRKDYDERKRLAVHPSDFLTTQGLIVEAEVLEGRPSVVILDRAGILDVDLLVIGAERLSAPEEFRMGSTPHKLAHSAEYTVLIDKYPSTDVSEYSS